MGNCFSGQKSVEKTLKEELPKEVFEKYMLFNKMSYSNKPYESRINQLKNL